MFKFNELPYVRPDVEQVKKLYEQFYVEFEKSVNYAQANALYVDLEEQLKDFNTNVVLCHIRNSVNTLDKFYEGEMEYLNSSLPELSLYSQKQCKLILDSPYVDDFKRDYGEDFIRGMQAEMRLTNKKVVPLKVEESNLCMEYHKTVAQATVQFEGEERNFYGLLKFMQSSDRAMRQRAYIEWAKLLESISDKLDAIYTQVTEVRRKIATELGFENPVEMFYLSNSHYYYTPEDVANFRKQVVEEVVPIANRLFLEQAQRIGVDKLKYYDEAFSFLGGNPTPFGTKDEMVEAARQMYMEMSPQTGEFFNFMVEHDLFDLETKLGKQGGGYCTFLSKYKAPFIFSNFNGTSADVDVLTHEAGHAFQAYMSSRCNPMSFQVWSTNEVSEIHSMTMELFAYKWMDKFFTDVDKYTFAHFTEAFKIIPYLCLVDHFQHEVYANPQLDAKGRRAVWKNLEKVYMPWRDYDGNAFLEEGAFWMQKQHIFLYPFYYVDYALAQMGAFEYYARSKKDFVAAWNDYLALCKAGGSDSYFNLLKIGNLSNPFKEGTVKAIVSGIADELNKKY